MGGYECPRKKTKLKVYRTPDGHSMVMSKEKMLELARTEWDSSKTMAENQIQVEETLIPMPSYG